MGWLVVARRFLLAVYSVFAFLAAHDAEAQGTPVLETLFAQANPCADLPQIDRLDSLRIDRVAFVATGATISATASGRVGCRTSRSALITSSLSADVALSATLDLATCATTDVSAQISNPGGSAGFLVDVFQQVLEAEFRDLITREAQAACRGLTSR